MVASDVRVRAHRFVIAMGVVALFGDLTYEGARSISGAFVALLGASAATVGFVVGLGELAGYGLRIAFGWLADRTGAHWLLVALGYGVNLVAVPGLALADRWEAAAALVVLERIGKALRSPSKSTLLSGAAEHVGHGKAFGLEEALDQVGALAGPLLVAAVVAARADSIDGYRRAFAALLVPVLLGLAVLALARRTALPAEEHATSSSGAGAPLGRRFYLVLGAVSLVAFGFLDWALLAVHAQRTELLAPGTIPIAYACAMGIDGAAALGFGVLFDRIGLRALALAALLCALAPLGLLGGGLAAFGAGLGLWAVGLGALESIAKAAVGKSAPREARGRAFGLFFGAFGVAWWLGSSLLGTLLDASPRAALAVSVLAQAAGAAWLFALARSEGARPRAA